MLMSQVSYVSKRLIPQIPKYIHSTKCVPCVIHTVPETPHNEVRDLNVLGQAFCSLAACAPCNAGLGLKPHLPNLWILQQSIRNVGDQIE